MIRPAAAKDLEAINEIYNQAVAAKFETGDTELVDMRQRQDWFQQHSTSHFPVYVYEHESKVVGWLSFSPYRLGRKAFRYTAEISYYVHHNFKGQGIGNRLVKFAVKQASQLKLKSLFAIVLDKNIASIGLLKKHNFTLWGHLPNIADFDGIECGHHYYGIRLG